MNLVSPFIRARIEQYAKNEIRFNLMAIIKNRTEVLQESIREAEEKKGKLMASLESVGTEDSGAVHAEIAQLEDSVLR